MDTQGVKHITKKCPSPKCDAKAFVQVVVVEETDIQKKIDAKAKLKLINTLKKEHKEGLHHGW